MTELKEHQQRIVNEMSDPRVPGKLLVHSTGSGKSLTAIATASALGTGATVVVPASLRENFAKEVSKHHGRPSQFDVKSYEAFSKDPVPHSGHNGLLILDEAHKLKNSGAKRTVKALESASNYQKKLLLTATPIVNSPSDIAPLINIVSGNPKQLPEDKNTFNKYFLEHKSDHPGILRKILRGARPYDMDVPKNLDLFKARAKPFVDFYSNPKDSADFPSVTETTVKVPLTPHQEELYNYVYRELPSSVKQNIENSLPANKKDSVILNRFLNSTRQISNTTETFGIPGITARESSPKIDAIVAKIKEAKRPSVIYSNYLDSGVYPLSKQLSEQGIRNAIYTGKMNDQQKADIVKKYNTGKLKALIISSAGGEGLDLRNTEQLHVLEPHFHGGKLEQVKGRAVRFKSHATLPISDRHVDIYNYITTMPEHKKTLLTTMLENLNLKPSSAKLTADQYLDNLSAQKIKLNNQFLEVLK